MLLLFRKSDTFQIVLFIMDQGKVVHNCDTWRLRSTDLKDYALLCVLDSYFMVLSQLVEQKCNFKFGSECDIHGNYTILTTVIE